MAKRIPVKNFKTGEAFKIFIEKEREWMNSRIVSAIQEAVFLEEDTALILEARITENLCKVTIRLEKNQWIESLSKCIKWYEEMEFYEKCRELQAFIQHLKEQHLQN